MDCKLNTKQTVKKQKRMLRPYNSVGFRNASSDKVISIPSKLVQQSERKFADISNKENLTGKQDGFAKLDKTKKKLRYKNTLKRSTICSFKTKKIKDIQPFTSPVRQKAPEKPKIVPEGERQTISQLRKLESSKRDSLKNRKLGGPSLAGQFHAKLPKLEWRMENKNIVKKNINLKIKGEGRKKKDTEKRDFQKSVKSMSQSTLQGGECLRLSEGQQRVFDHVMQRKNVFFTGCAGTGKSVLLKRIHKKLRELNIETYVTASTGLAAHSLNGTTLHSWAGIGMGKGSPNEICKRIRRQTQTLLRWKKTRVLIIDEVSMISGVIFEKLDFLSRKLRENEMPFGGIQLVLCGDFLQLPPVNAEKLTFEANCWSRCIPDSCIFELTEVFRQKDRKFVEILSELRTGTLSPSTKRILDATQSNIMPPNAVEIYSHRSTVARKNALMLKSLKGEAHLYEAVDRSPKRLPPVYLKKILENCPVPSRIILKVGAPVILMKNIEGPLVNGLSGVVVSFKCKEEEEGDLLPEVYFERIGKKFLIEKIDWSIERGDRSVLASRKQLPLELAWALTIHKCQGMTIDNAVMNLSAVWEPGHFYVAVSRLRTLEGLKIEGKFSKECVKANPKVLTWMKNKKLLNIKTESENVENSSVINKTSKTSKISEISEISKITRPFISKMANDSDKQVDCALESQQKRAEEDRLRRRAKTLSPAEMEEITRNFGGGAPFKRNERENIRKPFKGNLIEKETFQKKRRFTFSATDFENFDWTIKNINENKV